MPEANFWTPCVEPGLRDFYHYHWGGNSRSPRDSDLLEVPDLLRPPKVMLPTPTSTGAQKITTDEAEHISALFCGALDSTFPGAAEFTTPELATNAMLGIHRLCRDSKTFVIPNRLAFGHTYQRHDHCGVVLVKFKEYQTLASAHNGVFSDASVEIVGSKGIGKSFSLFYLLLDRLWSKKPTIWTRGEVSFFFWEKGVFKTFERAGSPLANGWAMEIHSDKNADSLCILIDV
ncbi:hypothetical protein C8R44DRAFT_888343 [Mycena epipterygia]|nr:hypothetical protein C8R44DRAFT_888343 [Mycena epipterygia]